MEHRTQRTGEYHDLCRFGFLLNFISRPVLLGFSSAAGLVTMSSTLKDFFGISIPKSQLVAETIPSVIKALPSAKLTPFLVSAFSLAFLLALKLLQQRFSRMDPDSFSRKIVQRTVRAMKLFFTYISPVLLLVAAAIVAGVCLCNLEQRTTNTPALDGPRISGTGASLPGPIYVAAAAAFNCLKPSANRIEFNSTGSGNGLQAIADGTADFIGRHPQPF
jgi:hypothetical protein